MSRDAETPPRDTAAPEADTDPAQAQGAQVDTPAPQYAFGLLIPPRQAFFYFLTAAVLAMAQSLGQNMFSANSQQLQGVLGTTQAETLWFTAAYMAPNAALTLLLVKLRGQFGLRRFAEVSIVIFLGTTLLDFTAEGFWSMIVMRFIAGCATAPMSSLAFMYVLDPLPPEKRMNIGIAGALTLIFMGSPVTRLISPTIIELHSLAGLETLEVATATIALALIYRFPLTNPVFPMKLNWGDALSFLFIAIGFGALTVVSLTGAQYWWTERDWLGWLLAAGIGALAIAAMLELNRKNPLLDILWLTRPAMLHFAGTLLLFRIVLSEQTSGAAGLFASLGLMNEQTGGLWAVVLIVTLLGGAICAMYMKPGRESWFHGVALVLLIVGSLMDSHSTVQTVPADMYVSQGLIALASALFLPPSLLSGLIAALSKGPEYILAFLVVFLTTQRLGAFLGSALFTSFVTERTRLHTARLSEGLAVTDPLVTARIADQSAGLAGVIGDPGLRSAQATAQLSTEVGRQASVMAYNDAFFMTAVLSAGALALLLAHVAMRKHLARPKGGAAAPGQGPEKQTVSSTPAPGHPGPEAA